MLEVSTDTIGHLAKTKKVQTHQLTLSAITYNIGDLRATSLKIIHIKHSIS